jgi:hypothetical protein
MANIFIVIIIYQHNTDELNGLNLNLLMSLKTMQNELPLRHSTRLRGVACIRFDQNLSFDSGNKPIQRNISFLCKVFRKLIKENEDYAW